MAGVIRDGEPSALSVRVDTLADDIHKFDVKLEAMQTNMATKADLQSLVTSINALSVEQKNIRQPNWQALGVAVTVLTIIGAILYWPIRETTADLKLLAGRVGEVVVAEQVKVGVLQEQNRNLDRRLDAISSRLAEFIRTGK